MKSTPRERKSVVVLMGESLRSTMKEHFVPPRRYTPYYYTQGDDLQKIKDDFLNECQIWSTLRHPCIVQFLGVYYSAMDQYRLPIMVMEKMRHSLRGLVEKYDNIPLNVKLSILDEVCLGLRYLHSRNPPIVHRDLTPNNILLSYHLEAKISDLGVAKVMKSDNPKTMTKLPGTPDFMPPEALSKRPVYGPSLDVFSYGGIILNVTTQLWPEPTDLIEINPDSGRKEAVSEVKRRQEYLDKMTGCAADLKPLVMSCLEDSPKNRPPVTQVSMTIKRVKDVCSQKGGHDGMSPIVWWAVVSNEQQSQVEQTTKMLREAAITAPSAKVQQPVADSQVDIFRKEMKWEELAPLPVCRSACYAVLLGGNVYVGGGFEERVSGDSEVSYRLDVYNLTKNQWSTSPITTPYCLFAMTVLDDKLVTAGGTTKNDEVVKKVLVLNARHWMVYSEMPTARCHATAVGYHSMLIVLGGEIIVNGKWTTLSTTELLDTTNGRWYTCNNLSSPHFQLKAAIMNNNLYVLGGFKEGTKPSPQVFVAPLDTLSTHQLNWQSVQTAPPWCMSIPVVLYDKLLLAVGGVQQSNFDVVSHLVYILNTSTGMWSHLVNMPKTRSGPAVVSMGNRIIVIGGYTYNNRASLCSSVWSITF